MIKSVFSRIFRGNSATTVVVRQLPGSGVLPAGCRTGGRYLVPSQKGLQQLKGSPPSGVVRSLGGVRWIHDQRTKGDEELIGFLEEEISTEKKMQRATSIPGAFEGFTVKLDKSEIVLTKQIGGEEVIVSANVNHCVDTDFNENPNVMQPTKEPSEKMRAKPTFDVEIKRENQIVRFSCSYIQNSNEQDQEEFSDIFTIDDVCYYEGEWKENEYAVAGDILDGYLYDLFMNFLEDRGVNNEFAEKFSDLCTDYEHTLYVSMLQKFQKFMGKM